MNKEDKIIQVFVTPESNMAIEQVYGLSENGTLYLLNTTKSIVEWVRAVDSPKIK